MPGFLCRQLVETRRQPLGQATRVDEDDCRVVLTDQLQQPGMDRRPDAPPWHPRLRFSHAAATGRSSLQVRHVLHRHLDGDLHGLASTCIDEVDLAADPAEEAAHLLQRALGRREPDPLRLVGGQGGQPLEAQGQVGAALGGGHRMNLVDDHPAHRPEHLARRAGEHQEERLRCGDQDVRRVPLDLPALVLRRVAGADGDVDLR